MGLLALTIFGPLTGIPGWVMANQDLRDIRSGIMSPAAHSVIMTGKILSITGTFFSLISLFIMSVLGFSLLMTLVVMLGNMF